MVSQVEKVNIFFRKKDENIILDKLQDSELVELAGVGVSEGASPGDQSVDVAEELSGVEYKLAGLKFAIDFLTPYETPEGSFLDRILAGKPEFSKPDVESKVGASSFDSLVKKTQECEASLNQAINELDKITAEAVALEPWRDVPFVLNHELMPERFDFRLCVGVTGASDKVAAELEQEDRRVVVDVVGQDKKTENFYVVFPQSSTVKVEEILSSNGVSTLEVEPADVTPSARLERIAIDQKELRKKQDAAREQAEKLAGYIQELRLVFDFYSWEKDRLEKFSSGTSLADTRVLTAWVERANLQKLETQLGKVSEAVAITPAELEEEEEPPVVMRNPKWSRPFEAITGIYGSPQSHEPDPTPWLVPFFVIFFGLALTDVGYGVLLAILALLGLKFMAHTDESKKLLKVMVVGGIATALLGALFGGWFGVVLDDLPASGLKDTLIGWRLIDPVAEPITVLIITFVLGIIQVMVGLIVNLWWQLKQKKVVEALLSSGVWLVFLSLIIAWVLAKVGVLPASSEAVLSKVLLVAVAGVVLAGTRKTKNWFLKLPIGILSLYDLVGYFSDVLSYSRLLALGLATGIIGMVINLIAGLAVDMIPVVGYVIMVLILVGGHLFNLAINVLGAYIHSSRLQFVEFFPKFMEGGGKTFQPFRKESKFIRLKES